MEAVEELQCGCVKEFINNKWIWIYCNEHETCSVYRKPIIKKYRKRDMEYD